MLWMLNNEIVDEDKLMIPVKDHGFLYGVGLFETFRVYDGYPFLYDQHLNRIQNGLYLIGIDHELEREELTNQLFRLLEANYLMNAYVRLTVTAGISEFGMPNKPYLKPNIMWQVKELSALTKKINNGKMARILKTRRNTPETRERLKTINFLNSIIGKMELLEQPNTEGIFLTKEGYVSEGTVSNLFFIQSGKIYTPHLDTGILAGVTREFIINLCREMNIPLIEGFFKPEQLLKADEIFITNSIQEIVPIEKIAHKSFSYDSNSITFQLSRYYKEKVEITILNNKIAKK